MCVHYLWQGALYGASYYSNLVPALTGKLRISDVINTNTNTETTNEGGLSNFINNEETEVVNHVVEPSRPLMNEVMQDIEQFLQRPVEIYSFGWDITGAGFTIDPLALWLANPAIARKLSNFMFLRTGGLKIKIVTNGTPYLYGSFGIGFWPQLANDAFATAVALASPQRISNLPQYTSIDPSTSSSMELLIPEFQQYDVGLTAVAQAIGSLVGIEEVSLENATASGTTQYCEISIYCSAINPRVLHNTFSKTYYATSAEYKGKISKPLSSVAKVSKLLSNIPVIGPYATALGEAASLGAAAAAIFGYSKPVTPYDPSLVVVRHNGNMANTEGLDTASSLTFAKQASSIVDPTYFGLLNEDQLAISYIIRRWSLSSTNVTWADTDAVNTVLSTMNVGPHFGYTGTYPCAQTNIGYISEMFGSYRGSIEVKAVFCISQFHTGRLQILYDPAGNTSFATDPTNVDLNWIVDLKEQREVVMKLPYAEILSFTPTNSMTMFAGHVENSGPRIIFRVINRLRAGAIATTVTVKLYVRAGEDFEFADPTLLATQTAAKQAVFQPSAAVGAAPTNSGFSYYGTSGIDANYDSPVVSIACNTERVVSLRNLLKRYQFEKTITATINSTAGNTVSYQCLRDYPLQPGTVYNGSGTTTVQLNAVPHNAMTWIGPSFVGWRGSIKTKLFPLTGVTNGMFVNRTSVNLGNYMSGDEALSVVVTRKWFGNDIAGTEFSGISVPSSFGSAASCTGIGGPVEIANHWVCRQNFELVSDYNTDYKTGSGLVLKFFSNSDTTDPLYAVYRAVGDDFMFLNYKGPPIIYEYTYA